jgi:hypothetical protein
MWSTSQLLTLTCCPDLLPPALQAVDRHNEAWSRTDSAPGPIGELPTQDPEYFLKRAGGKPIYDQGEPKVNPWTAAFTRRREIFAGRIAMVGVTRQL